MKKMNFTILGLIFLILSSSVFATEYVSGKKVFIEGYDPVSYQTKDKAEIGSKEIIHTHDGVKIQFSSEENKNLFITNPKKYMPAYKGWCAYAMAQNGKLVDIDPKSFKVTEGKTYLFYNGFWGDTLKKWKKLLHRLLQLMLTGIKNINSNALKL